MKKILLLCMILAAVILSGCNNKTLNSEGENDRMKVSTNIRSNYVEKIVQKYTPPQNPQYTVIESVKNDFEKDIGVTIPNDYYDFLNTFGDGSFSEYLRVTNPFVPDEYEEYFIESEENADIYRDLKKMRKNHAQCDSIASFDDNGDFYIIQECNDEFKKINADHLDKNIRSKVIRFGFGFPYDFYKDGSGLVYWGYTDDHNFFWNFDGDNYTIVMYGDGDEFYEYDMSFSEFVYHFLNEDLVELGLEEPFIFIQNN